MVDAIYLFNGSRRLDPEIPLGVLRELQGIRPLEIQEIGEADSFLDTVIPEAFDAGRQQVNMLTLVQRINREESLGSLGMAGKVVVVDHDAYFGAGNNWSFGVYIPTSFGLGYVVVSSARFEDETLAKYTLKHELGHMFGAPSEGRSNTTESLGLHCVTDLCTMQQKLSVRSALGYARRVERSAETAYCHQCTTDIQRYTPKLPSR